MTRRLWETIDRWGPAAVSVVTLLAVVGMLWIYSERIAHLEGQVDSLQHQVDVYGKAGLRRDDDIDTLRNWIIAVYERGSAHGWDMPKLPEDRVRKSKDGKDNEEKKGKPTTRKDNDNGN